MGKFNRGGGFGGGNKFGGRDRSFDRNAPREMHKAVCADCGNECEVPFKPSGDRPVLCSMCFKNSRGDERGEGRREERRDFDRPRNEDKRMYDATCAKCGDHCQIPFQPKPGRDVLCSDCFGQDKGESRPSFSSSQAPKSANYDKQFELLNSKLNKLIELLSPKDATVVKSVEAVKEIKKSIPTKALVEKVEEKKSSSAKAPADKAVNKIEKSAPAKVVAEKVEKKADKKAPAKKKSSSAKAPADKASKKK
jgi:CxxC-x17-CxxC domain-containing protein